MGQVWTKRVKSDPLHDGLGRKRRDEPAQTNIEQASGAPGLRQMSWKQKYTSGWRAGAILCCTAATLVLITNISVLIWAVTNSSMIAGIGTLCKGSCARTKSLNTWLQLVITSLCTVLLGASNYCMQCLTSPTRAEIDKAHSKKQLLRIGIPSPSNLKFINRSRFALWISLGLSAFPLHFL